MNRLSIIDPLKMRHVVWFSCGVPSAVTSFLIKSIIQDSLIVYCDPGHEHKDNWRFFRNVEKWLDINIIVLRSEKYSSHFDVVEKTRYINGPMGARCTTELKKRLRIQFQLPDDIQYFGYTADIWDMKRAERFKNRHPEIKIRYPLIEHNITRADCFNIIEEFGITLPRMYRLGYHNNNCIGCVKGGAGYWNKIRTDFPDDFEKMVTLERQIGHSCIRGKFLSGLKPGEGRY